VLLHWISLTDHELPFEFAIAPLTGHLVRRPRIQMQEQALGTHWLHRLMGWRPVRRMPSEVWPDLNAIIDPAPLLASPADEQVAVDLSRLITRLLRYLPLLWVIRLADWLPAPRGIKPPPQEITDLTVSVAKVAQLFGHRTRELCLLKAIERRTYLRWLGISSQIRIGLFVPTEEMHAWVEIDQKPILESPDFLVHYRVAITID
jgi:hypothetical protein